MVEQRKSSRRRNALMAVLFSQMSRSPELTKLMVLLLVWGHVRSRPGYTTLDGGPSANHAGALVRCSNVCVIKAIIGTTNGCGAIIANSG